jgi:RNA polymerase sigma-70 factor, ECF subfamily
LDSDPRCSGQPLDRIATGEFISITVSELTRRLSRGDEEAFRIFYDTYCERLSRYMLVVTAGDEIAANDAVQGMLVRLVKYVRVFTDEKIFWSWLTVLCRSSLSDDKRKRRRYLAFLDRFSEQSELDRAPIGAVADERRLAGLLELKLHTLTEQERHLIDLKYFVHMSARNIAEQMNLSEKAVESSLVRIRRKLKKSLLDELKDEPRL